MKHYKCSVVRCTVPTNTKFFIYSQATEGTVVEFHVKGKYQQFILYRYIKNKTSVTSYENSFENASKVFYVCSF